MKTATATITRRHDDARAIFDSITDPCSVSAGAPLSILDMGIIEKCDIESDGLVRIALLPTFPGCRFVAIFEDVIRQRFEELEWCRAVEIDFLPPTVVWDESRMTTEARSRVEHVRQQRRRELAYLRKDRGLDQNRLIPAATLRTRRSGE